MCGKGSNKKHYQTDIFYDTEDTFGVLGTYSTEEKAIKVLDMIAESYGRMKSCDCYMSGIADEIGRFSQKVIDEFADCSRKLYVFQMPQDSEV